MVPWEPHPTELDATYTGVQMRWLASTRDSDNMKGRQMSDVRLTRREKRQMGLLPRQIARTMIEMRQEGYDLKAMSREELAVLVMAEAQADNPEAWQRVKGDRDWETFFQALAEFLETVVPIILQLITVFI